MPSLLGDKTCARSEEHTSELQSHDNLVCRLLLEKNTQGQFRVRHRRRGSQAPRGPPTPAPRAAPRATGAPQPAGAPVAPANAPRIFFLMIRRPPRPALLPYTSSLSS